MQQQHTNAHPTRIYILLGPTAVGKTSAGISIAKQTGMEILSADSMQIYRELNIGSAKPTQEEMQGVAHHLIDVTSVQDTTFSVARFRTLADEAIADMATRNVMPLVVGGTGLYIHALTHPLQFAATPADNAMRASFLQEEARTPGVLYQRLQCVDPISAARVHPNDKKRIIRALEVYALSGKPLSTHGADFHGNTSDALPYEATLVGLTMDRDTLYARIEARVDAMMRDGLLEEVHAFFESKLDRSLPALQGLGYKQLLQYFYGEISLEQAVTAIKQETRRFAKRQFTWFKRDSRIHWLDITHPRDDIQAIMLEQFRLS